MAVLSDTIPQRMEKTKTVTGSQDLQVKRPGRERIRHARAQDTLVSAVLQAAGFCREDLIKTRDALLEGLEAEKLQMIGLREGGVHQVKTPDNIARLKAAHEMLQVFGLHREADKEPTTINVNIISYADKEPEVLDVEGQGLTDKRAT